MKIKHFNLFLLLLGLGLLVLFLKRTMNDSAMEVDQLGAQGIDLSIEGHQSSTGKVVSRTNQDEEIEKGGPEQAGTEITHYTVRIVSATRTPIENARITSVILVDGETKSLSAISNNAGYASFAYPHPFQGFLLISAKGFQSVELSSLPSSGVVEMAPISNPFTLTVLDNWDEFPIPNCQVEILARRQLNGYSFDSDWAPTGQSGTTGNDGTVSFSGDPSFARGDIVFVAKAEGFLTRTLSYSIQIEQDEPIIKMSRDNGRGILLLDVSGQPLPNCKVWYPTDVGAASTITSPAGWMKPESIGSWFLEQNGRIWFDWITVEYEPGRYFSWVGELEMELPKDAIPLQVASLNRFLTCTVDGPLSNEYSVSVVPAVPANGSHNVHPGFKEVTPDWVTFDVSSNEVNVPITMGGDSLFAILRGPHQQILLIKEIRSDQKQCHFDLDTLCELTLFGASDLRTPIFIKPHVLQPGILGPILTIPPEGLIVQLPPGRYEVILPNGLCTLAMRGITLTKVEPTVVSIPLVEWKEGILQGSLSGPLKHAYLSSDVGRWTCSSYAGSLGNFTFPSLSSSEVIRATVSLDPPRNRDDGLSPLYRTEISWEKSSKSIDYTVEECRLRIFRSDGDGVSKTESIALLQANGAKVIELSVGRNSAELLRGTGILVPISVEGFRVQSSDGGYFEHMFSPLLSAGESREYGYNALDFQQ